MESTPLPDPAPEQPAPLQVQLIERDARAVLAVAQGFMIDCPELAEAAADDLQGIKAKKKALTEQRQAMTRPLDESKGRIMGWFGAPLAVLDQAEGFLKAALADWMARERQRVAALRLEQERQAAQAQADQAAQDAQALAQLEHQKQSAQALAQEAAAEGDTKAADALDGVAMALTYEADDLAARQDEAAFSAALRLQPINAPDKLDGVSGRQDFKAEVFDLRALVLAVANGDASLALLEPNQKEINKRARALKTEFRAPGIRVYAVDVISVRAGKRT